MINEPGKPTVDDIILYWLYSYGNRIPVKEGPQKRKAFYDLINTIKSYGYTKEDLSKSKRLDIVNQCVPKNYDSNKSKIWKKLTKQALNQAILVVYPVGIQND